MDLGWLAGGPNAHKNHTAAAHFNLTSCSRAAHWVSAFNNESCTTVDLSNYFPLCVQVVL